MHADLVAHIMMVGISNVLDAEQLSRIREVLEAATFVDGGQTAGYRAKRVKSNLQLDRCTNEHQELVDMLVNALTSNKAFNDVTLPKAINKPLFSRYEPGMNYGFHVDAAVMNKPDCLRTDVSVTVFLNDPEDYEGGELVIQTPYGEQKVKLKAGDAVAYDASRLHAVMPVKSGVRLVAVTWVQSFVRDAEKRNMLNELVHVQKTLNRTAPDDVGTDLSFKLYQNLYRMWAET